MSHNYERERDWQCFRDVLNIVFVVGLLIAGLKLLPPYNPKPIPAPTVCTFSLLSDEFGK